MKKKPPQFPHAERVHAYARDVVAGRIVAGRYVRAACQRHLEDLAHGHKRGLFWWPAKAESVLSFFEESLYLKPGRRFHLEAFQAFITGSEFGWWRCEPALLRAAGKKGFDPARLGPSVCRRRFRVSYSEMGKGNGKTPLSAGVGLYGLVVDTEEAPQVYPFAAAKEQARLCLNDAKGMVRASPDLSKEVVILTNNLSAPARSGKMAVLSSEDKGHHGLRVHMGLGDEIHAHASAAVVDTVEAGTKNCRNSLIKLITNSGSSRLGPCWAYRSRALAMLRGKPDDELFAYVCALDPCPKCEARGKQQPDPKCRHCDSIEHEAVWPKANPGLGPILDRDYLARRVALAKNMPSKRNNVLQLNFCLWTDTDDGWLDMYSWRNRCLSPGLRLEQFAGKRCWLGMDAANRVDATCLAILFQIGDEEGTAGLDPAKLPEAAKEAMQEAAQIAQQSARAPDDPDAVDSRLSALNSQLERLSALGYALFLRTYVPRAMVENQSNLNSEAYMTWSQSGHLIVTDGATTDFHRIEEDIKALAAAHTIVRLQADPRELGYFLQRIGGWAGFEVVQVSQGPMMISQPMKFFEGLVAAGLIKHDGNPVLDWMLGNVVQKTTRTGGPIKHYYPTRPSEEKKIDAAPAAFMALDACLRAPVESVGDAFVVGLG